jgi:hypothetical protein
MTEKEQVDLVQEFLEAELKKMFVGKLFKTRWIPKFLVKGPSEEMLKRFPWMLRLMVAGSVAGLAACILMLEKSGRASKSEAAIMKAAARDIKPLMSEVIMKAVKLNGEAYADCNVRFLSVEQYLDVTSKYSAALVEDGTFSRLSEAVFASCEKFSAAQN